MTFDVGQGVSEINPEGFHLGMRTRLIFRVFFSLFIVVSPRIYEQNLADLFGVSMHYYLM